MFIYNRDVHGITVPMKEENVTPSALSSLRIALRSYFETYHITRHRLNIKDISQGNPSVEENDFCHSQIYQEKYIQTIFHFHHFLELFMKDNLRLLHPVLASKIDFSSDGDKLLRILRGDGLSTEESISYLDNHSVEFDKAQKRLLSLRNDPRAPAICATLYQHSATLKTLNDLRNRAWHRGTYVLRYSELDEFIGANVLPLIKKCLYIDPYKNLEIYWKYKAPAIGFDPIDQIISSAERSLIDFRKIAFMKAVGRASYNIPRVYGRTLGQIKRDAEVKAESLTKWSGDFHCVRKCFVCEQDALLLHAESDYDYDDKDNITGYWTRTYAAKCENCGLDLYHDVGNPQEYGFNIDDLWFGEEHK